MIPAFILFIAALILVLYFGLPMSLAMFAGFIIFLALGLVRGHRLKDLLIYSFNGAKDSLIVVRVMLVIGILTGLWRSSGTFAILTAWGLRVITPDLFILAAFILSCILSYALGTSFGTVSTLGIALITLARSGGADPLITAGAVMSGIHFGDRGSPSSSCLHLVTSLTGTNPYDNVKNFMKSALIPLVISLIFYAVLSYMNPLQGFNDNTLNELDSAFNLSPVIIMLVLPLVQVNIFIAFLASIIAAFVCSIFIQDMTITNALSCALNGYHDSEGIRVLFNGGGLTSMIETSLALIFSGTFLGIFEGTGMLEGLHEKISVHIKTFGAYPVILVNGTIANSLFCNQTVGVLMTSQIMKKPYLDNNMSMKTLAWDLADSTVITAPLIPWCMACYFPLNVMNESFYALIYSCYLYLIPLCRLIKKFPPVTETRGKNINYS